jgi:alkanesulfonate monooxygenase SsuD/methylene tetrahydromethanopterin reductase-like flavin-dependent oxidoreductase (luciferase family)
MQAALKGYIPPRDGSLKHKPQAAVAQGKEQDLKFGFVLPGGDAAAAVQLAQAAEEAGWDGFFMWEPVWGIDPWVALGAVAAVTNRIRIGTMLTPVSRRRPWKLASETATLDHLSNGRLVLAVGLGAVDTGFEAFGEATDRKTRAELLDEGLEILTGLWRGQPFTFEGRHYQVSETSFLPPPPPVQQPRIPIWVVGAWNRKKSMSRALKYDGLLPNVMDPEPRAPRPEDIPPIRDYVEQNRPAGTPYEIVVEGETPGTDPRAQARIIRPYQAGGATWWIETRWNAGSLEESLARVRQGPPAAR